MQNEETPGSNFLGFILLRPPNSRCTGQHWPAVSAMTYESYEQEFDVNQFRFIALRSPDIESCGAVQIGRQMIQDGRLR